MRISFLDCLYHEFNYFHKFESKNGVIFPLNHRFNSKERKVIDKVESKLNISGIEIAFDGTMVSGNFTDGLYVCWNKIYAKPMFKELVEYPINTIEDIEFDGKYFVINYEDEYKILIEKPYAKSIAEKVVKAFNLYKNANQELEEQQPTLEPSVSNVQEKSSVVVPNLSNTNNNTVINSLYSSLGNKENITSSSADAVLTPFQNKNHQNYQSVNSNQSQINRDITVGVSAKTEQSIISKPNTKRAVNKVIYLILTFFLGGFGIHKFYAGKKGVGFLFLIFCWTLIPAIIATIEFWVTIFKRADENGNIYV